jgi:hypothetical protein
MTRRADPPRGAISHAEFERIQAEAKASGYGLVLISAPVLDPEPGAVSRIAEALLGCLFPALAEPEPEAEI